MRKRGLLTVVILACVLLGAVPAAAQVDLVGHVGYNSYSMDWGGGPEPFNSGLGGFGALRYWVTDTFAVGAGLDYLTGSGSASTTVGSFVDTNGDGVPDTYVTAKGTADVNFSSLGVLAAVAAKLPVGGNLVVQPFGAVGSYGATVDVKASGESGGVKIDLPPVKLEADRQIGYLLGVHLGVPVTSNIHLGGTAGYRWVSFPTGTMKSEGYSEKVENTGVNASGLFGGVMLSVNF